MFGKELGEVGFMNQQKALETLTTVYDMVVADVYDTSDSDHIPECLVLDAITAEIEKIKSTNAIKEAYLVEEGSGLRNALYRIVRANPRMTAIEILEKFEKKHKMKADLETIRGILGRIDKIERADMQRQAGGKFHTIYHLPFKFT